MNFYLIVGVSVSLYFSFLITSMFVLKDIVGDGVSLILEWSFSENFLVELSCPLVLDLVSCLFSMAVLFISGSVIMFSGFYMSHESFLCRFVLLVLLFVLSMLFLILFPNFLFMMVGWDGLGVVSFLLVVYYMNNDSLSAGMITAISNRVGDVLFIVMLGMMCCFMSFSFSSEYLIGFSSVGILVLFGSMTKSAQIPFSAWLPEAMAAPTPVSTLVHSSTLVTAGVYVLVRFSDLLSEVSYYLLILLSMMTVIMSGSGGAVEVDMKKVVALSTLSQVGMMMFAISLGAISMAFFHLLVHAFFKALMFMCVGGVIFYSGGVQDARCLSGLWMKMPFTCGLLLFTNLSLMGFPFMSGFYSKEMILGTYLSENCSILGFFILFLSLIFTGSYSVRMMLLMMSSTQVCPMNHYKEWNKYYIISLVLMSNGAVFVGLLIQLLAKEMVFFVLLDPVTFYSWVFLVGFWFVNVVILLLLSYGDNKFKSLLYWMMSKMWFLKEMSGNLISSNSLLGFSKLVSFVEMGWIRSQIWGSGLKQMVFEKSNTVRKLNFHSLGLIMMVSLCLWVAVLV